MLAQSKGPNDEYINMGDRKKVEKCVGTSDEVDLDDGYEQPVEHRPLDVNIEPRPLDDNIPGVSPARELNLDNSPQGPTTAPRETTVPIYEELQ